MKTLFVLLLGLSLNASGFMIPDSVITDWKNPGSDVYSLPGTSVVNILDFGGKNDSSANNNTPVKRAITALGANGGTVYFPAGTYRFDSTIVINQDKIILLGTGAQATRFAFGLGNRDNHCIQASGSSTATTTTISGTVLKGQRSFSVANASAFSAGDWVFVRQGDSTYFTSDWSYGKFIQIARIDSISGNRIVLDKPVRHTFFQSLSPYIQKINPRKNIGIECIELSRLDEPSAGQSSVVFFSHVVNSWIKGIESDKCQFAHVTMEYSSNVSVLNSYFHHAFNYGGGGRGYGCVMQFGASNNLIQNNVFKHLRHAVLLQASPNGNVVGYNYMFEPFWDEFPQNSAGQIVLHGNYPFTNLFEGNICENLVIDNSHGLNGPYNTFLRNRFTGFGIFMATGIASRTNFVGNENTGTLYTITGPNNYLYGNNNKGSISPSNISSLPDTSYYLQSLPPAFWTLSGTLPTIGYPKAYNSGNIPARARYTATPTAPYICDNTCTPATPTLNLQGAYTLAPGDSIVINSTPPPGLQWTYSGSNISISFLENSIIVQTGLTTTSGTLGFYTSNACGNSGEQTSKITMATPTGIRNNKSGMVSVYPNPSNGEFIIEFTRLTELNYTVTNMLGQQLQTGAINSSRQQLDLGALEKGIYLLQLEDAISGEKQTIKLIRN